MHAAVDAAFDDRTRAGGARRARCSASAARVEQRPERQARHADGAGRPGRLPGQRAVGAEPRRPRQPPAGRLRPSRERLARRGSAPASDPPSPTPSTTRARSSCCSPTSRSASGATAPSCSTATSRSSRPARRPTTCWPSTAAAPSPSPPGCRSASAARGGWGDTTLAFPRASGSTCSPAPVVSTARCAVADAARRLPGRAARARRGPRPTRAAAASTSGRRCPRASLSASPPRPATGSSRWSATTTAGGARSVPSRWARSTTATWSRARTATTVVPDPRSRRQPHGVHERSRTFDPGAHTWGDDAWTGRQLAGLGGLRAARRHVHARGHPRRGHRPARPPAVDRRRPRRADAGQRVQRRARLGLRRRRLVRGARAVRRPRGVPALRRRLPPGRARRRAGRGLQPPRAVRELPAAVRSVPVRRGREPLGRARQPRRRGQRGGTPRTSSTTCGCGSRTTTSTRCGSMPCTRSWTPRRCTCSRRSRWWRRRCRRTCAARSR